jgi:hypothetical protein
MKRKLAVVFVLLGHAANAQPICDGIWHWVDVPETICGDGTPSGYQYACTNPTSSVVVGVTGGGACWDASTCDCQPDQNGLCNQVTAPMVALPCFGGQSFYATNFSDEKRRSNSAGLR